MNLWEKPLQLPNWPILLNRCLKNSILLFRNGVPVFQAGKKQRIMLARALAINPKILLLDDFTSRVDKKTENKILCNLENNYPGMTLISVTQKIAPIRHFEQIYC